jgi:aminoglycoside 2'-N-acetyltransferase I
MVTPKAEVKRASDLSPEIAKLIRRATEREFGSDPLVYAEPGWYVLGFLEEMLVARVGVLERTITLAKKPLRIGGVCSVVTEPEYRHRGIASTLMGEAVVFLREQRKLPFGLLTCKPRLEPLYARLGWRTVDGSTVFIQEDGMHSCGGLTMVFECAGRSWPEGKINLCGLPW